MINKSVDPTLRKDLQQAYSVFPKKLIEFAEKARVHTGYWLIKGDVMHATDPKGGNLSKSKGIVVSYDNKIGSYMESKPRSSMTNNIYTIRIFFTTEKAVKYSCTCSAGSCSNDKKSIFVHVLPVLYQLTMLMFEDLAVNLLHELLVAEFSESFEK